MTYHLQLWVLQQLIQKQQVKIAWHAKGCGAPKLDLAVWIWKKGEGVSQGQDLEVLQQQS